MIHSLCSFIDLHVSTLFWTTAVLVGTYSAIVFIKDAIWANFHSKQAKLKRKERDLLIQNTYVNEHMISSANNELILKSSVTELIELMNNEKITSVEILLAYYSRAITIGKDLELIADVNFSYAIQRAKECDRIRLETTDRTTLPPLFGIPISIKDSIDLQGLDSTNGLAKSLFKPIQEDGLIVRVLKHQGAIPFIKTSTPQYLFLGETVNNIWGRAKNPWNRERTTGGSTGGGAGMIASRCSPLELGTDVAGSIRCPSLYCGVYGFKPTTKRVTMSGITNMESGDKDSIINLETGVGPIGRTTDDLALFMKSVLTEEIWKGDVNLPRVPWRDEIYKNKGPLRIGYLLGDDYIPVSRANKRAVKETETSLRMAGHHTVEITFPKFKELALLFVDITSSEGGSRGFFNALEGETMVKEYRGHVLLTKLPNFVLNGISIVLRMMGEQRMADVLCHTNKLQAHEYFTKVKRIQKLADEFVEYWKGHALDAIILPGAPHPAVQHGMSMVSPPLSPYLFVFNLMNFPAGAIPITKVREGEDVFTKLDDHHDDKLTKTFAEIMKGSVGLPVGVQVIAKPFCEEMCLNVMKRIEEQINFHELPV